MGGECKGWYGKSYPMGYTKGRIPSQSTNQALKNREHSGQKGKLCWIGEGLAYLGIDREGSGTKGWVNLIGRRGGGNTKG